jgi:hypothetical protein
MRAHISNHLVGYLVLCCCTTETKENGRGNSQGSRSHQTEETSGSKRILTIPLDLNIEWIVDSAISLGYKELKRGSISTGIFSSCPCIIVGSLLAKQKFGIVKNKDNIMSLLYSFGSFTSDYKLIKFLCSNIIEQLKNKYNGL